MESSKEPEDIEIKSNSKLYLTIFIGAIILIFIGIIIYGNYLKNVEQKKLDDLKYNNFEFIYDAPRQLYFTSIEIAKIPYEIPFFFHPTQLEDIFVDEGVTHVINNISGQGQIIITLDTDLNSTAVKAGVQISRITGERFNIFNIPTGSAFTSVPDDFDMSNYSNETNATLPFNIVTCDDANVLQVIIHLRKGDISHISYNGNCITLTGKNEEDLVRVAERFTYELLGIM